VAISFRHSQVETKSHGVDRTMTSTGLKAALIAETVGVRQVVTTAELRDLIAPLKFFWLDVFAGDEASWVSRPCRAWTHRAPRS
jgi:hypothetical protein